MKFIQDALLAGNVVSLPSGHTNEIARNSPRCVLVTGASTGIGLVTAVELAKRGRQVFATMRNLRRSERLHQAVKIAGVAAQVDIGQLDVISLESIKAAVKH